MSRYIDADKLTVYFETLAKQAEVEGLHNMAHVHNRCLKIIEDAPTADVVEVVRCKDCIHARNMPLGLCYLHTEPYDNAKGYKGDAVCVEPDDYCSYGERSEGE
jgi:hypothetical protein